MSVILKKASTVILLRQVGSRPEVFLIKRHENNRFMGGMTVYPGGRVEEADGSADMFRLCRAQQPEANGAFKIAAIREVFEEAGVLFISHRTGGTISFEEPAVKKRFDGYRKALNGKTLTFPAMLQQEGVFLSLDELVFAGRWMTPEARSMRFDTLFFAARIPLGQEPTPDSEEATEGLWMEPREALRKNREGNLVLSPPTLITLEDLSRFRSVDEALRSVGQIYPDPVLPILLFLPHGELILFPWDGDYERARAKEPPETLAPSRPARPGERTTRLILHDHRYLPRVKDGNP